MLILFYGFLAIKRESIVEISPIEPETNDENSEASLIITNKENLAKLPILNHLEWVEILLNKNLTSEFDLSIFQALYSFPDHKAAASEIAESLETTHSTLNSEIEFYAKRIIAIYKFEFMPRNDEKYKYWDLFFNEWNEGSKLVWQLKPELLEAMLEADLTGEKIYPVELSEKYPEEFFEGTKRTIIVNAYERNPKARQCCVDHWKAICAVCSFDFAETYGEIGKGFIHVHHLMPVSQVGKDYKVDQINDLIPICPNCHSMLHRQEPPLAINQLKALLKNNKKEYSIN